MLDAPCRPGGWSGEDESMLERAAIEATEAELLRRIAQRDHAALGELYDGMGGVVFSLAMRMLSDQREAEEVVQDVFLQIWNKAATFDGSLGSVLSWSLGITRNRCIDYLRARQRRTRIVAEATLEAADEPESAVPGAHALGEAEQKAIRAAVAGLPTEQQQAISMAFFGGMTHQEIADVMGEPLGTVKARIRRGMLKLKESLRAYE